MKDFFSEFEDGEFAGVANIHGANDLILIHEANKTLDEVINVTEGAGLLAFAVNRKVFSLERLYNEIGNHPTVICQHAGPVGIENAHHPDIDAVLAMVVEEKSLGAAFAFVVTGADPDRVDVAPIGFGLRVHRGIAVDLGSRGLEDPGIHPLGKTQAVDRSHDGSLGGLDRIELVMNRGGGAGEIIDLVHFQLKGIHDVVPHQLEVRIVHQMGDVDLPPRKEVVHADNLVAFIEEAFA